MKHIKYHLDAGGADALLCILPYSEENLKIAEAEALNGVTVEDDGLIDPAQPTQLQRLEALEAAVLEMILGGEA